MSASVAPPPVNADASPDPTEEAAVPWKECLVRVHLGNNEHVSSIPVKRLLAATESDRVSYSTLYRFTMLSAKFGPQDGRAATDCKQNDDKQLCSFRLHYGDENGEHCLFKSDAELMEALEWAAATTKDDESPPTLNVYAVADGSSSSQQTTTRDQEENKQSSESPRQVSVSSPEIEVPTAKPSRDKPLFGFFRNARADPHHRAQQTRPPDKATDDTIAHVLIDGLAHAIATTATLIEEHQDAASLSASQHGRRCSWSSLKSETVDGGNVKVEDCFRFLRRKDGSGGYKRVVLVKPSAEVQKFDLTFVHKRHTCDGCKDFPIVGYRYHANPNIDLCQACFDNAFALPGAGESSGETILFKLTQCRSDKFFMNSKLANTLMKFRKCLKALPAARKEVAPQCALPASPSQLTVRYEGSMFDESSKVSDFDVAMAIQRSLHDLRKMQEGSNVESAASVKDTDGSTKDVAEASAEASSADDPAEPTLVDLDDDDNLAFYDCDCESVLSPNEAEVDESNADASVEPSTRTSEAESDSVHQTGSTKDANGDTDAAEDDSNENDWCIVDD